MSEDSSSGPIELSKDNTQSQFTQITLLSRNHHSELYKAQRYGKFFVLKTLPSNLRGSIVFESLLRKEFSISILMNHPNVVQTYSLENVGDLGLCIVMEYIDGRSLADWLAESPSKKERIRIMHDILNAVSYIHTHQVVHRDLKPSNILLTHNGNHVKIIDFGYSDSDAYAVFKQPAGTLKYMAPEQRIPNTVTDQRADVYSIGMLMKEVLPSFNAISNKCCQEDPSKRYQCADEIVAAIKQHQRLKRFAVVFGPISCLAILAGLFFWWQSPSKDANPIVSDNNSSPKVDTAHNTVLEKNLPLAKVDTTSPIKVDSTSSIKVEQSVAKPNKTEEHQEIRSDIRPEIRRLVLAKHDSLTTLWKCEMDSSFHELYTYRDKASVLSQRLNIKLMRDIQKLTLSEEEYNYYWQQLNYYNSQLVNKYYDFGKSMPSYSELLDNGSISKEKHDALENEYRKLELESKILSDSLQVVSLSFSEWFNKQPFNK